MDIRPTRAPSRRAVKAGISIVAGFYLIAIFADLLAPYGYADQVRQEPSAPPTVIRMRDQEGRWQRPFIYARRRLDPRQQVYEEDVSRPYPLRLFAPGHHYKLFGFIPAERHLVGVASDGAAVAPRLNLLGTDQLGRDRFSRLLYAIRFSLLVSPVGTLLACLIGITFGAVSGYAHRLIDTAMMGVADTMISLPTLILILAARAAFPLELPPMTAALLLIVIFAATGWAEMARLTRGLVVGVKGREYILAARASGVTEPRILWRHILPNISTPLVIQATLMLPVFLLAEVAMSFLGVGLQEPEPSLGNMLSAAADITQIRDSPVVLLSPAAAIFVFVLGIRLIGWRRSMQSQ